MDITVQELKQKLDQGESFVFIDVREPYEYQEFNIGARLIPLGELMGTIGELSDYQENEVIVHCRSGARSAMAQQMMQQAGFTNVRNVIGGVLAWQDAFGK